MICIRTEPLHHDPSAFPITVVVDLAQLASYCGLQQARMRANDHLRFGHGVTPAGFFSVLGPNMSKGPFMEGWALRDKLPMPHLRGATTGTPLV